MAGSVASLMQIFMSLLYLVQLYVGDEIDTNYYYLMAILSPSALSLAIDKVSVCHQRVATTKYLLISVMQSSLELSLLICHQ